MLANKIIPIVKTTISNPVLRRQLSEMAQVLESRTLGTGDVLIKAAPLADAAKNRISLTGMQNLLDQIGCKLLEANVSLVKHTPRLHQAGNGYTGAILECTAKQLGRLIQILHF